MSFAFRHIEVVWYRHGIGKVSSTGQRREEREVSGINKVGSLPVRQDGAVRYSKAR